jgi:hypothetical protein
MVVNLGLLHLWKFKLASGEQQEKRVLLEILLSFMNIQLYSQRHNNVRVTTKELISLEVTFFGTPV